jgi:hypothetical protein
LQIVEHILKNRDGNKPDIAQTFSFSITNLALFSYNLQVYEGIKLLHHHLTDPPDLDRQVIVEEMIQKYWPDLFL